MLSMHRKEDVPPSFVRLVLLPILLARMPGGIPVATVAIGKAGAKNAAYLAAQILAVTDAEIATKLRDDRNANGVKVQAQNERLQNELGD